MPPLPHPRPPAPAAPRARPRPRTAGGFTLVELMVVVVLIGILTAVIIPEMRGTFQDAVLRAACRDLVNVCDLAASRAVSRNQICRVRFEPRTGKYVVERRVRGQGAQMEFAPIEDMAGGQGKLDHRIVLEVHEPGENPAADYHRDSRAPADEPAANSAPPEEENRGRAATDEAITFYPDGTAEPRELLLRDPAGFRLGLHLNPATGRFRVIELARG